MLYTPESLFGELLDAFLAEKKVRVKFSTYEGYESIVRNFLRPAFGTMELKDIRPIDIRQWQNEMMTTDYSPRYLRRINAAFSAVFNYGLRFFDVKSNPVALAGTIGNMKNEELAFWTLEQYRTFIGQVVDREKHMAFQILYWTGMRRGELQALTPADFNAEEKIIKISKTYRRWKNQDMITEPKTKKSRRTIYLHDDLVTEFAEYLEVMAIPKSARIFTLSADSLLYEIKRICRITGLKPIRVHDFRHSHASLLIEMNMTPLLISERLGHEKVETTLSIYAHLYPNKQQYLAEELNRICKCKSIEDVEKRKIKELD